MRIEPRENWDILTMSVLTVLLIMVIYLLPDSIIRTIIGLPFLLFFPGYLSVAALFPAKDDLDSIERVALSFGLSIAITPLIGFGLNYTPWGIRLTPILLSISAFILLAAAAALYRRQGSEDPFVPFDPLERIGSAWGAFQAEKGLDKALSVILALSILSSVFALAYVIAFPQEGEAYTEFYVLGADGTASNYPQPTVGENGTVILGLVNHEQTTMNYTILVWLVMVDFVDNETVVEHMYFYDSIEADGLESIETDIEGTWTSQWEYTYDFNIFTVDTPLEGDYKLWFNLYKEDMNVSYVAGTDYVDDEDAVQSIVEAVENDRQSLNLNMELTSTEFYLLDADGNDTDYPVNITTGVTETATIGIANHEFQTMNYTVQVFISNSTEDDDGNITFESVYYLGNLTFDDLPHMNVSKGANWTSQAEQLFNFTVSQPLGNCTIWFVLYEKETAPTLATGTEYKDDDTVTALITACMDGDRRCNYLEVTVSS